MTDTIHRNEHIPDKWYKKADANVSAEQECIPVGCIPPTHRPYLGRVSAQEGCLAREVSVQGVSVQGTCLSGGCLPGGCTMWPIPSCI